MTQEEQFKADVNEAFSKERKSISSRWFYDDEGSELFRAIMSMKEYYPTDCEYEIFDTQGRQIADTFSSKEEAFDLVELGAGDGMKTKVLLKKLLETDRTFRYRPIDISKGAILGLQKSLESELPGLDVLPAVDMYFPALEKMKSEKKERKRVVLFLGSNIGNFSWEDSISFLKDLHASLSPGDMLLIGIDLKKNPHMIRLAYADPSGITKRFNLNLLKRINRELGGHFLLDDFGHYQSYDPISGEVRSYIFSKKDQEIKVDALNKSFHFGRWEMIHTEISRKYDPDEIGKLAEHCGFEEVRQFFDCKHFFSDNLWRVK